MGWFSNLTGSDIVVHAERIVFDYLNELGIEFNDYDSDRVVRTINKENLFATTIQEINLHPNLFEVLVQSTMASIYGRYFPAESVSTKVEQTLSKSAEIAQAQGSAYVYKYAIYMSIGSTYMKEKQRPIKPREDAIILELLRRYFGHI